MLWGFGLIFLLQSSFLGSHLPIKIFTTLFFTLHQPLMFPSSVSWCGILLHMSLIWPRKLFLYASNDLEFTALSSCKLESQSLLVRFLVNRNRSSNLGLNYPRHPLLPPSSNLKHIDAVAASRLLNKVSTSNFPSLAAVSWTLSSLERCVFEAPM